ncbi:hypothetical protein FCM35_KLT20014 [Carex littledalei]|uniref:Uncharacterized protein n=1 Tax=Carex littledalei TaxID=544730 RepID=A0A833R6X5_9POAL|nr:hypothetical protein FCM35_KLT20014 [Carex littledalei]
MRYAMPYGPHSGQFEHITIQIDTKHPNNIPRSFRVRIGDFSKRVRVQLLGWRVGHEGYFPPPVPPNQTQPSRLRYTPYQEPHHLRPSPPTDISEESGNSNGSVGGSQWATSIRAKGKRGKRAVARRWIEVVKIKKPTPIATPSKGAVVASGAETATPKVTNLIFTFNPKEKGVVLIGPQEFRPQDLGPQKIKPQDSGPQVIGPQEFESQEFGPQDFGHQDFGPQDSGPQVFGPQEFEPQEVGLIFKPQHLGESGPQEQVLQLGSAISELQAIGPQEEENTRPPPGFENGPFRLFPSSEIGNFSADPVRRSPWLSEKNKGLYIAAVDKARRLKENQDIITPSNANQVKKQYNQVDYTYLQTLDPLSDTQAELVVITAGIELNDNIEAKMRKLVTSEPPVQSQGNA